ncbi:MAG: hypothetical protein V7K97_26125 [Nostoc sp.]|uniref:hypothetical protein n=1 Tax=Nostoc sp. TaxID=1180 RepID=UPI002FF8FF76
MSHNHGQNHGHNHGHNHGQNHGHNHGQNHHHQEGHRRELEYYEPRHHHKGILQRILRFFW